MSNGLRATTVDPYMSMCNTKMPRQEDSGHTLSPEVARQVQASPAPAATSTCSELRLVTGQAIRESFPLARRHRQLRVAIWLSLYLRRRPQPPCRLVKWQLSQSSSATLEA